MSEALTIADNAVVEISYTLYSPEGEVIDGTDGDEAFPYLHGHDNIVPGLERQLAGASTGDKLTVSVSAAEGYGERDAPGPQRVPHDAFPDGTELEAGAQYAMMGEDNQVMPFWVLEVSDEGVVIDFNHPLAGVDLRFEVEVKGIRPATPEELEHGHVHGEGGHHHH